jgi:hypothetical protein
MKGFFRLKQRRIQREYFDDNFECTPQINMLSWTLSNGIITATNGTAIDRWVITELTANRLVFKFQFDVDSDGELEYLKPYATVMNLLWRYISIRNFRIK